MGIAVPDLAADRPAPSRSSEIKARGGVRWWLEGRPDERGRQVLVRRDADGTVTRLSPEGFNVRSRVHEYGGAAYLVEDDLVIVSDFSTGRLNRVVAPGRARAAHARAGLALRRHDPGPGPRPAHRDSRGPRDGDARAPRRGRERDRRHRPREWRGLGPRRRCRLLRRAAPVAGWLAARLARVAPPEHAMGRHDAAPRAGRRRRLDRRGGDRRRQPVGLDLAAALVARRRPPLRRRARRLDEPVPVRRRPGRGGHGPSRRSSSTPTGSSASRPTGSRPTGRSWPWPGRVVGIGCTASGRSPAPSARSRCRSPR